MGLVTTGHDVADARLHRTVAALRRAGCEVWVRGLAETHSVPEQAARGRARAEPGSATKSPARVEIKGPRPPDTSTSAPAGKLRRGLRALLWPWQARCDILLTIDPDTAPAAWLSSKVLRRRWVADVHEDYRELLRDRGWVPRPLLAVLRGAVSVLNSIITRADLVLVADAHVPPLTAPRRFVMRNVPDVTLLPPMPEHTTGDAGFRAVYIGDNRTSRGLRDMVEAIAATADDPHPWHFDLIGPIAKADRDWFDERSSRQDARNLTWHGRRPPAESWRIADGADVGFCLLADTPAFRDAMPSKVYEYLAMGMPTVATSLPRVAELLEGTGAGVIADGVPATVEALRRYAAEPDHRGSLVANARAAGAELRSRPSSYDEAAQLIVRLGGPSLRPG